MYVTEMSSAEISVRGTYTIIQELALIEAMLIINEKHMELIT